MQMPGAIPSLLRVFLREGKKTITAFVQPVSDLKHPEQMALGLLPWKEDEFWVAHIPYLLQDHFLGVACEWMGG